MSHLIDEGHVEIEVNAIERSNRPLALSSENALCEGSTERWAVSAAPSKNLKLTGVELDALLADVISKITKRHFDELMPWAYPAQSALTDVA